MATLKAYLSKEERNIVQYSIVNEFGKDFVGKVHLAFEISRIITSSTVTDEKIKEVISSSLTNKANRKVTSLRLTKLCYDKINKISQRCNVTKIDVIRAFLFLRNEELSVIPVSSLVVNSQISRIENIFQLWYDEETSEIGEYSEVAKDAYQKLGWDTKSDYYDIINTLWLNKILPFFAISSSKNNPERPLYKFSDRKNKVVLDTAEQKASQPNYIKEISKEIVSLEITEFINKVKTHCGNRTKDKRFVYKQLQNDEFFNEASGYIYTIPNFCPVPKHFNSLKGIIASDSLFLMIELIEKCLTSKDFLSYINKQTKKYFNKTDDEFTVLLNSYKDFLIENRENFSLQDYYLIIKNDIIGLPDFPTQSLDHPIPTSYEEIAISIQTTLSRVTSRAHRINS